MLSGKYKIPPEYVIWGMVASATVFILATLRRYLQKNGVFSKPEIDENGNLGPFLALYSTQVVRGAC